MSIGEVVEAVRSTPDTKWLPSTATYPLLGLHCAACVARAEKAVQAVPGVTKASVNLASETLTVTYLSGVTGPADLAEAVADAGFRLFPPRRQRGGGPRAQTPTARAEAAQAQEVRAADGQVHSGRVRRGRSDAHDVHPHVVAQHEVAGPIMFVLATPVQLWAGWQFYRGAWAALRHGTSDMNTLIAVGTSVGLPVLRRRDLLPGVFEAVESAGFEVAVYYDTAVMIIGLILLGRFLEARAKGRTGAAMRRLMGLQAKTARVVREQRARPTRWTSPWTRWWWATSS